MHGMFSIIPLLSQYFNAVLTAGLDYIFAIHYCLGVMRFQLGDSHPPDKTSGRTPIAVRLFQDSRWTFFFDIKEAWLLIVISISIFDVDFPAIHMIFSHLFSHRGTAS